MEGKDGSERHLAGDVWAQLCTTGRRLTYFLVANKIRRSK